MNIFTAFVVGAIGTCFRLYAIYIGNPLSPAFPSDGFLVKYEQKLQPRIGYQGDYLSQCSLKRSDGLSLRSQMGSAGVSWDHRWLAQITAGSATAEFSYRSLDLYRAKSSDAFAWGGEAQGIVKQWDMCTIGIAVGGFFTEPHTRIETVHGVPTPSLPGRWKIAQWQGALGAAYRVDFLAPYLGTFYQQTQVRYRERTFHSHRNLGIYLGCSLLADTICTFTLEARLLAETAFSIAAQGTF